MNSYLEMPVALKIYHRSRRILTRFLTIVNACFIGFWLGILPKKLLHLADQDYYNTTKMYCDLTYNKQGLWQWEKQAIETYFQARQSLLLIGAGGGREVYALAKMGYRVDGYECNPKLVEFANQLLSAESLDSKVRLLERDCIPQTETQYEGAIIGWGAYMLIQGKANRVQFLKQLRSVLAVKAPILISFYHHANKGNFYFKAVVTTGNVFRRLFRRDLLEIGDDLSPEFVHYFNQTEIEQELKEAGFELALYGSQEYGHAVGILAR